MAESGGGKPQKAAAMAPQKAAAASGGKREHSSAGCYGKIYAYIGAGPGLGARTRGPGALARGQGTRRPGAQAHVCKKFAIQALEVPVL